MHNNSLQAKYFLVLFYALQLLFFWPGVLSPDSQCQYQHAIAGTYNDHHPAVMSFVWRYLDMLYQGSGLLYSLHLAFLYIGLFYLIKALECSIWRWYYLFVPVIPQVAVYSVMVWKDIGFAYAYVAVVGYLTYLYYQGKQLKLIDTLFFLTILFYGTAIKYQGQFLAPIVLFFCAYLFQDRKKIKVSKTIIYGFGLIFIFYGVLNSVNNFLVPEKQKSYSWQYVKLYDLAALSVAKDQDFLPKGNKSVFYNFEKLKQTVQAFSVDELVFPKDAILRKNPDNSQILKSVWLKTILAYPFSYLKHRLTNLSYMLCGRVGFTHIEPYTKIIEGCIPWLKLPILVASYALLSQMIIFALLFATCILLGWRFFNNQRISFDPTVLITLLSLTMLSVMLVFTMAGTPRYTYIVACLVSLLPPLIINNKKDI